MRKAFLKVRPFSPKLLLSPKVPLPTDEIQASPTSVDHKDFLHVLSTYELPTHVLDTAFIDSRGFSTHWVFTDTTGKCQIQPLTHLNQSQVLKAFTKNAESTETPVCIVHYRTGDKSFFKLG